MASTPAYPPHPDPSAHQEVLGSFSTYAEAQAAVDRLSDAKFDVSTVSIVGHGLTSVEQVTGRMTKGRATLYGLGGGAWFGLLIGVLLGIFAPAFGWLAIVLTAVIFGAVWGAIFGFLGHLARGGQRDFDSINTLAAQRYDVLVAAPYAAEATALLRG